MNELEGRKEGGNEGTNERMKKLSLASLDVSD